MSGKTYTQENLESLAQERLKTLLLAAVDFVDNGNPQRLDSLPEGELIKETYLNNAQTLAGLDTFSVAVQLLVISGLAIHKEVQLISLN